MIENYSFRSKKNENLASSKRVKHIFHTVINTFKDKNIDTIFIILLNLKSFDSSRNKSYILLRMEYIYM